MVFGVFLVVFHGFGVVFGGLGCFLVFFLWFSMVSHSYWWFLMVSHSFQVVFGGFDGFPWFLGGYWWFLGG